jgi:hypothetical protein
MDPRASLAGNYNRAAAAIGTTMPAGTAAAGHRITSPDEAWDWPRGANGIACDTTLSTGPKADSEHGCGNNPQVLSRPRLSLQAALAINDVTVGFTNSGGASGGGASGGGASDDDASPNDDGPNDDGASDVPSALLPA